MPFPIYAALFALAVGTLIVPTGAQLVGRLIEMLGAALQRHGESLSASYCAYGQHWEYLGKKWPEMPRIVRTLDDAAFPGDGLDVCAAAADRCGEHKLAAMLRERRNA